MTLKKYKKYKKNKFIGTNITYNTYMMCKPKIMRNEEEHLEIFGMLNLIEIKELKHYNVNISNLI